MRSLCLFASYFTDADLPYYITVYLKELNKHFDEVRLLCTQQKLSAESLEFLKAERIQVTIESDEGFDFGQWYKAFGHINAHVYDRIALINDSCILFSPLDAFMAWANTNTAAFQGMTVSDAVAPHLQSYFLLLNKPAIPHACAYFKQHGLLKDVKEVIRVYEIGLSSYLLSKEVDMAAYMDNNGYSGEFSPYYQCLDYHIANGIPVIKKKILYSSYRKDELFTLARMNFNISVSHYIRRIKKYNSRLILDFEKLKAEAKPVMSPLSKLKYQLFCIGISMLKPLYKKLKHA